MTVTNIQQLDQRIGEQVDAANRHALETWRGWANAADIIGAKNAYGDDIDTYETALADKRIADNELRVVKEEADDTLADADWDLAGCFETQGNKTVLVREADGSVLDTPRPMVADDVKAWKKRHAKTLLPVADVLIRLHKAEMKVANAADDVRIAEARISAAKYTLQAATAMLTTQAAAHPKTT